MVIGQIAVKSSAAVMLAAGGEVLCERSGVINLGLEGMMLCGALAGFVVGYETRSVLLACGAAMAAGGLLAGLHAALTIGLRAHQVLCGLALTLLGTGLATFLGRGYLGLRGVRLGLLPVPGLADIPVLGDVFFRQNALVYAAAVVAVALWWLLFHTRLGLRIRAVGEDAAAADAAGVPVARLRAGCVVAGGMLAGLGGAYLSLAYTPGWKEGMTGGQGWIAVAMVIFSGWRPLAAAAGALLFGGLTALQFQAQVSGQLFGIPDISPSFLRMLPYLLTIAVLATSGALPGLRKRAGAPGDLGRPFSREG
ncbi:ABC transporter permease [Megalodesulfovibrio paquesii]